MLGENWHNNHHGAPGSATTWVNWYQIDCQYVALDLALSLDLSVDPLALALSLNLHRLPHRYGAMRLLERLGFVELVRTQPPSRVRPGYEMITFLSIALSWLEMALVMLLPYAITRLYARCEPYPALTLDHKAPLTRGAAGELASGRDHPPRALPHLPPTLSHPLALSLGIVIACGPRAQ